MFESLKFAGIKPNQKRQSLQLFVSRNSLSWSEMYNNILAINITWMMFNCGVMRNEEKQQVFRVPGHGSINYPYCQDPKRSGSFLAAVPLRQLLCAEAGGNHHATWEKGCMGKSLLYKSNQSRIMLKVAWEAPQNDLNESELLPFSWQ